MSLHSLIFNEGSFRIYSEITINLYLFNAIVRLGEWNIGSTTQPITPREFNGNLNFEFFFIIIVKLF